MEAFRMRVKKNFINREQIRFFVTNVKGEVRNAIIYFPSNVEIQQ